MNNQRQELDLNRYATSVKSLYIIGGIAALLQLAAIVSYAVILAMLGPKPTSAEEFFLIQGSSRIESVLRGDILMLVLIGLYLGTFPALYVALRRINPIYTALATVFTLMVVTTTFASEPTFSLLYLGERYLAAATEAQRAQYIAAGEAVISADFWNSSGAYMGGILLQGAGVMISMIMLRSTDFSKITAYAGLIGNGLDLLQHVLHPFAPGVSEFLQMIMGPFYLIWFIMLARDFFRLARRISRVDYEVST
jgi:hypothetical protein